MPLVKLERLRQPPQPRAKKTKKTVRFAEGPLLAQTIEIPPRSSSLPNSKERDVAELSIPVDLRPGRYPTPQTRHAQNMSRPVPGRGASPRPAPNPSVRPAAGGASNFTLPDRAPPYRVGSQTHMRLMNEYGQTFTSPPQGPIRRKPVPVSTRPSFVPHQTGFNGSGSGSGIPMHSDGINTTGVSSADSHSTDFGCPPEPYLFASRFNQEPVSPNNDGRFRLVDSSLWYSAKSNGSIPTLLEPPPYRWTSDASWTRTTEQAQPAPNNGPPLRPIPTRCVPDLTPRQSDVDVDFDFDFGFHPNVSHSVNPSEHQLPTSPRTPPPPPLPPRHTGREGSGKGSKAKAELEKVIGRNAQSVKANGNLKATVEEPKTEEG